MRSQRFHFRAEPDLLRRAQRIARKRGVSLSSILSLLLQQFVEQEEQTAKQDKDLIDAEQI